MDISPRIPQNNTKNRYQNDPHFMFYIQLYKIQ